MCIARVDFRRVFRLSQESHYEKLESTIIKGYFYWDSQMTSHHSSSKNPVIPPLIVLPFGLLAASSAAIFIRLAQTETPSLVIAAWRLTLATIILTPFALPRGFKELKGINIKTWMLLVLSGVFLAFHFWTWITSLAYTTVAISVVIVTTSPLWVVIFSTLILRQHIPKIVIFGLLVALVGGTIIGFGKACELRDGLICKPILQFFEGRDFLGILLALAGAIFAAGYMLVGKKLRSEMSTTAYIYVVYGVAAVVLLMGVLITRQNLTGYPAMNYLWFAALAVFPQLLGHSSFNWALKYLSAVYVSISLLIEPVFSTILAFLIFMEKPTIIDAFGAVFILVGIFMASRTEKAQS